MPFCIPLLSHSATCWRNGSMFFYACQFSLSDDNVYVEHVITTSPMQCAWGTTRWCRPQLQAPPLYKWFLIVVGDTLHRWVYFNSTAALILQREQIFTSDKGPPCLWARRNKAGTELWRQCCTKGTAVISTRKVFYFAPCLYDRRMNVMICCFLESFRCLFSQMPKMNFCAADVFMKQQALTDRHMLTGEESWRVLLCSETGCIWSQVEYICPVCGHDITESVV